MTTERRERRSKDQPETAKRGRHREMRERVRERGYVIDFLQHVPSINVFNRNLFILWRVKPWPCIFLKNINCLRTLP